MTLHHPVVGTANAVHILGMTVLDVGRPAENLFGHPSQKYQYVQCTIVVQPRKVSSIVVFVLACPARTFLNWRDPSMTDEEFQKSLTEREAALRKRAETDTTS